MSARLIAAFVCLWVSLCAFAADLPPRPTVDVVPTPEQRENAAAALAQLAGGNEADRAIAVRELRKLGAAAAGQLRTAAAPDPKVRAIIMELLRDLEVEVWEGFYYYSLGTFEASVANGTQRVRFWLTVQRSSNEFFLGRMNEEDENLGEANVQGRIEGGSSMMFLKQYAQRTSLGWQYEGRWSAENGRIEGTYGPGQGGFILFMRPMTAAERKGNTQRVGEEKEKREF